MHTVGHELSPSVGGRGGRYDGHIMGGKRSRQGEGAYSGRGGLVGMGCWEMPSGQGMDPVGWISSGHGGNSAMLDVIATGQKG